MPNNKTRNTNRKILAPQPVPVAVPAVRYLTVQGAAAYLSTTPWAIRQLISTRQIPFGKIGKWFILDVQDLDNYFEWQKVKAAA